jgi:hypothetical protein
MMACRSLRPVAASRGNMVTLKALLVALPIFAGAALLSLPGEV